MSFSCSTKAIILAAALAGTLAITGICTRPATAATGGTGVYRMLSNRDAWRAYKARFVTEQGRVVDTENQSVSHSEGQGYAMLLAVAADDRAGFERIWGWTRANLFVRNDSLAAWRWEPNKRPAVAEMNNATDGDVLIAWALTEAAEAWNDLSFRTAARRIAVEIGRKLIVTDTRQGPLLLPGMSGFSQDDRADGPVLNLSYYVFPAFARLPLVAPEMNWAGLSRSGLRLVDKARFGPAALPADWMTLKGGDARPAAGFPAQFSYNAIRIPLYMAWAGLDPRGLADRFKGSLTSGRAPLVIDLASGSATATLTETGYEALPALVACASADATIPARLRAPRMSDTYYSVTLHLLALVAAKARYAACLRD